ncbi:MAG: inositol-3-phosphate synthase [Myxococcota bacterium]
MSRSIRFAIAGVGNCASALLQGIALARRAGDLAGVTWPTLGGYWIQDLEPVAAFDIDARKVGRPLAEACFAAPNCARVVERQLPWQVEVSMAPVLDGMPAHFHALLPESRFVPSERPPCDVARELRDCGAEVLVCFLPVGAQRAVEHLASACLEARVALVNAMPVFIASDRSWAGRFAAAGVPMVGDDIKSQVGATVVHRALVRLLGLRGVRLLRSYQLNTGGNTDFLNMADPGRIESKRISKTEAVQSQLSAPLNSGQLFVGPAAYIAWQGDEKTAFIRLEWEGFGGAPGSAELRLQVHDSLNSAGVVVDALRAARLARDRGLGGPLEIPSAWTMKHPPIQWAEEDAAEAFEQWCEGPQS